MRKISLALRGFIVICAVCLGTFYFVASAHLFPVFGVDSPAYIIPILNSKAGRGLTAVAWPLTRNYDPTGRHRFLQYPPLFQLTVAGLIADPTPRDVFLCLACFAAAALALYTVLLLRSCPEVPSAFQLAWLLLACLSLFSVSTWLYLLPSSGRPEALATPVILLATLCVLAARPRLRPVVAGIFIGVLGGMQIAAACLAGLLFSVYISLQLSGKRNQAKEWLFETAVAGVLSVLVFAAGLLLSPFGFIETLRGILVHMREMPAHSFSVASFYLFPAPNGTFYGLFLLILLMHFLWHYRSRLNGLAAWNLGAFLAVAWFFAIRHPNRSYNLLALSPVLIILAFNLLAEQRRRPALLLYFGIFSLMSIGFFRQALIYRTFQKHGVTYQEAQERLNALLPASKDAPVLFDTGIWALLEKLDHAYWNTSENLSALDPVPETVKPVLIVHQWYGRWASPPIVPGYRLIWNDYASGPPPSVLGIKIGTAMPGYAFAFYVPTASQ